MRVHPELIVCISCDTVNRRPTLQPREVAVCSACGGTLLRGHKSVQQLAALGLTAAMLCLVANVTPMLGIDLSGRHSDATLWGSVLAFTNHVTAPMAVVVAMAVVVLPALQIAILCWLSLFALAGRRAPLFKDLMRAWQSLHPWCMVEVAMLGILVTYVKLKGLFHVDVGVGIWAMAGLAIVLTVVFPRDVQSLWNELAPAAERDADPAAAATPAPRSGSG
jgi:paraquat-inducible protein A